MPTWSNKEKTNAGIPEVDFIFSDGSDFLFSDGTDYVFREETTSIQWGGLTKNSASWANVTKTP